MFNKPSNSHDFTSQANFVMKNVQHFIRYGKVCWLWNTYLLLGFPLSNCSSTASLSPVHCCLLEQCKFKTDFLYREIFHVAFIWNSITCVNQYICLFMFAVCKKISLLWLHKTVIYPRPRRFASFPLKLTQIEECKEKTSPFENRMNTTSSLDPISIAPSISKELQISCLVLIRNFFQIDFVFEIS